MEKEDESQLGKPMEYMMIRPFLLPLWRTESADETLRAENKRSQILASCSDLFPSGRDILEIRGTSKQ